MSNKTHLRTLDSLDGRTRAAQRARALIQSYEADLGCELAHYVEREINRLLAARSAPIALPTEPATPDANAPPGQPAPRPLAGPILPLVASSVGTDQLLGGPGVRPVAIDALAARAGRSRRRFYLAAPRSWKRTSQGRDGNGIGIARCRRPGNGAGGIAKAEKTSQPEVGPV